MQDYTNENQRNAAQFRSNAAMPAQPIKPELILASGSRFRLKMLEQAGVHPRVVVATVDETAARRAMAAETTPPQPGAVALRLAALKALEVSNRHPEALVIGADQILAFTGDIFGKPANHVEARAHLQRLRGHTHHLPTGVVLAQGGQVVWQHLETVALTMRPFSDTFLDTYLAAAGDLVLETVGGYALEGLGAQLFERVEGDYFTVIGLPLIPLLGALRQRGVLPS
jgi:septum formation protein